MRVWLPISVALLVLVASPSSGEDAATKRDRQGPVTVTVTLLESSSSRIKASVVLDTHSGSLDGIAFARAMSLRRPTGGDVAPTSVEPVTGDGHHRQAVVVFPPAPGAAEVRIVVKDVGGVAERVFGWSLPLAR
jgi:hypothetical protein